MAVSGAARTRPRGHDGANRKRQTSNSGPSRASVRARLAGGGSSAFVFLAFYVMAKRPRRVRLFGRNLSISRQWRNLFPPSARFSN